jgi:hypothetical protein
VRDQSLLRHSESFKVYLDYAKGTWRLMRAVRCGVMLFVDCDCDLVRRAAYPNSIEAVNSQKENGKFQARPSPYVVCRCGVGSSCEFMRVCFHCGLCIVWR